MHGDYGEICCHSSTTVYCSFEAYSSGLVPHSFPQKQWFYWPALHPEIGERGEAVHGLLLSWKDTLD